MSDTITPADLEREAQLLSQRLGQVRLEIKRLSQRTGAPKSCLDTWMLEWSTFTQWVDITELYDSYCAHIDSSAQPCLSRRKFGEALRARDGVLSRLHPVTRRAQLWLP